MDIGNTSRDVLTPFSYQNKIADDRVLWVIQYGTVTPEERQVAEGVRELRAELHESQQAFSNRLGVSISTIARYELQNPPQGTILIRLAAIARETGRIDLEVLFEKAFEASVEHRSPIAEAIRGLRATAGESQQEFAQRAGLSVVSIARYETNAQPKKSVLARLVEVARDLDRPDLRAVFEEAQAAEAAKAEADDSVLSTFPHMGTPEGADFLRRISEKRLKRMRSLFSKLFQPERELSAMCSAAWLLEHYRYFNERDRILVDEIKRVLERRAIPLTAAELEMLGDLGRRAVAEEIKTLPMSEAIRRLRQHLDMSEDVLAAILETTVAAVAEFEAGTRTPGKPELEAVLGILRTTIHKMPELELAFSMALVRASRQAGGELADEESSQQ